MKRIAVISLFLAVITFTATDASAQTRVGANVGYNLDAQNVGSNLDAQNVGSNLDAQEFFAGAQARFGAGGLPIIINPSIETYFIDNLTWLQIDVNALYPFGVDNSTFTPYAGGGLGVNYIKPENLDSRTDAGLNLIAGATFGFGRLTPFAEARINFDDGTNVGVRGGVLFAL